MRGAPALGPVLALLLGAGAAWQLSWLEPGPVVALAGCGIALGGRRGLLVLFSAAGLLLPLLGEAGSWSRPPPDPERPVELVGRLAEDWRQEGGSWRAELAVERYRQGAEVVAWRERVRLYFGGDVPPVSARRVRVKGLVGRAPGHANVPPSKPGPWRLSLKSGIFYGVEEATGRTALWRRAVRRRLSPDSAAETDVRRGGGAMVRALLLGERGVLPPDTVSGLRRLGLSHLFAVSGLHVGMVAALGLLLPIGRRGRLVAAAILVLHYLWIVGPRPSLLRASAMTLLAGGALLARRPPAALNALALAVLGIVMAQPRLLADIGLQLSATATAGILVLAPRLARWWSRLPRPLALPLSVTVSAQLGSLAVALPAFHLYPLLAPLANLLFVPWTAVVLASCLLYGLVAAAAPDLARQGLPLLDLLAAPFAWPGRLPAAWTAALPVAWNAGSCLLVAAVALVACRWPRRAAVGIALALLLSAALGRPPHPELVVWDVGQGASVLLRDGRRAVLVDGGGWRQGDFGGRVLLPALAATGIRRLDAMAMTHPHLDHCGGLVDLARLMPVADIWASEGWGSEPCWESLLAAPGPARRWLESGDTAVVGRWRLRVLAPTSGEGLRDNDRSLVLMAETGGYRFLVPGDVERAGERDLVERWGEGGLDADVLVVAHHGSRTSTTEPLLAAVSPRLALIPVGLGNSYNHPAPDVVERLLDGGVRVLRTDRDGMIRIRVVEGRRLQIETPAAPR